MIRVYILYESIRDALVSPCFPKSRNRAVVNQAAIRRLDVDTRTALAATVRDDVNVVATELNDIEQQLEQATKALEQANAKEQLIASRYRKYRTVQDDQAKILKAERQKMLEETSDQNTGEGFKVEEGSVANCSDDTNEEKHLVPDIEMASGDEQIQELVRETREDQKKKWEERMERWEKDEDALHVINQTQLAILTQCEQMKRDIRDLQMRKVTLLEMSNKCKLFLETTTMSNQTNQRNDTDDNQVTNDGVSVPLEENTGLVNGVDVEQPSKKVETLPA